MKNTCRFACAAFALLFWADTVSAQKRPAGDIRGELLGRLIYTDVTVELEDTPARTALRHLKAITGVNIIGRYDDDRVGFGIDPETPVTVSVTGQPALRVLEMILDQCGGPNPEEACTWQLRQGFIEVGTKERLNQQAEVRTYAIHELLMDTPQFHNSPDFNIDAALNQGVSGAGGGSRGGAGGGSRGGRGSGGGSSGGEIFGPPDDDPDRTSDDRFAQDIVDVIQELIEPDLWITQNFTVRYTSGVLLVRAPDYVHRQIAGYPYVTRPLDAAQPTRRIQFGKKGTRFDEGG